MRNLVLVITLLLVCLKSMQGQSTLPLAATDGLGRVLSLNEQVGDPKQNRHVGMFYFIWHGDASVPTSEKYWDLTEIHKNHPEVFEDFNSPYWGGGAGIEGRMYYWGQPIYGYYAATDYWVQLRSVQLLADAGVDFFVFDTTNDSFYPKQLEVVCMALQAVYSQRGNCPKIVFYTNTESGERIQEIYNNVYKEGARLRNPNLWFHVDGKPLIIGVNAEAKGRDYEKFFTIRESQWPYDDVKVDGWPWIEFERPQRLYYNHRGEKEIVNVSVCQHPNPKAGMGGSAFYGNKDNWGRSYRNGSLGNPDTDILQGYNFQEQWDFALKQDVPYIFVTSWNEWTAGKWASKDDNPLHSWFCDQASPEYSRDLEPSLTAGLKDHYYMQLVDNIRRYKGVPQTPISKEKVTITKMSDWNKISLVYRDYVGEVTPRNHQGAQTEPIVVYTNNTGRNDFDVMKVTRDNNNLYFYAKTVDNITPNSGNNWMTLYLDFDRNGKTGWCGYDYRIVGGNKLQKYNGAEWVDLSKVSYTVSANEMMASIPSKLLGKIDGKYNFEFKWADNMQSEDPMDWYVNGDTAPGARFNYIYKE